MLPVLLLIPLILIAPVAGTSAVLHVPDDYESIQTAIEEASDGDVVLIEPGEYVENLNFLGKAIVVTSRFYDTGDQSYIHRTIIDGDRAGRVVIFRNDEGAESQLIGLTITNGLYTYGGGVYMSGASPTLRRLIIRQNEASNRGGGVYCTHDSRPIIDRVIILDNAGGNYGGIDSYDNSNPVVTSSIIWWNEPATLPGAATFAFSNIEGIGGGEENIEQDPGFIDWEAGDFNLTEDSPCVDTGDPEGDLDADGTRADMGALSYTHLPSIDILPVFANFGELHFGAFRDLNFRCINVGEVPLTIESAAVLTEGSPFSVTVGGDGARLDPDDELRVTVRFAPEDSAVFLDSMRVISDDPDDGEIYVRFTGVGSPPIPAMIIEPHQIEFGRVALHENSTSAILISNEGDADLSVSQAAVEQEDGAGFGVDFNGELTVAPSDTAELTVRFSPTRFGAASAQLVIESNDPETPILHIELSGEGVRPNPHYQFAGNTGVNHSVLILDATLNDEPLGIGSEIGVFTPAGLCSGEEFWMGERVGLAAWGDNEMTEALDGFRDGEEINYRIWDIDSQSEYLPAVELVQGDRNFQANGVSVVRLAAADEVEVPGFTVYTGNNWSILSAPVIPDVTNIPTLWRPVVDRNHLVMIKDASGRFYVSAIGFSNLGPWDYRYGYLVRGNAVDSLFIEGDPVDVQTEIPLRQGWSLVAYYPEQALTAQVAFRNILNVMTMAKDASGRFYVPAIGFSNMLPLRRGLGYYVRVSAATNLVWNLNAVATSPSEFLEPVEFQPPAPTGCSMSLLLSGIPPADVTEVAAVTPAGLIVGAAALNGSGPWGMAIWQDDPTTAEVEGALPGEALRLIGTAGGAEALPVDAEWDGQSTFEPDSFAQARFDPNPVPGSFAIAGVTPNPFNGRTTLSFTLPKASMVSVKLFNLTGGEVGEASTGAFPAGRHSLSLNAELLPAGVYLARVETGEEARAVKLMLLK